MDLDLFSAFDGSETVEADEIADTAKVSKKDSRKSKRKAVAAAADDRDDSDGAANADRDEEDSDDDMGIASAKKARTAEPAPVPLIETEPRLLKREDGTSVKVYSVQPADWITQEYIAPPKPAKEYPFKLDPFQEQAVHYIERNESVLVSAHTSAGKTVCAEYAIARSLRDKQRVIYTSPIKALSNQKYRDLQEEFNDVGLMTGDITINPSATCLVMTTEILRSMLYRGSEVMREVAWVIYDEIHYMRDKTRGVVWEESIILLPHKVRECTELKLTRHALAPTANNCIHVRFVFLSATIPNSIEFVSWVARQHHQVVHVVYTDYRPTPLQHYLFPSGGNGIHLVVDDKGRFLESNFQQAMATLQATPEEQALAAGKKAASGAKNMDASGLKKIVDMIMKRNLYPAIVFSFSKKETEVNALLMKKMNFNSDEEAVLVKQVYTNALESLADEDRTLPQEGLIKCLFATETFSIGLNMPARTVVFTSTRKWDGCDFRWLTSGEYIQSAMHNQQYTNEVVNYFVCTQMLNLLESISVQTMSGRAGRRGKDVDGKVIQMLDEKMDPDTAKAMLYGAADPLHSSYHINYNMLLNMLRVEDADPEFIVKSSFHQFQQQQGVPKLEEEIVEIRQEIAAIAVNTSDSEVTTYHSAVEALEKTQQKCLAVMQKPEYALNYVQ
eukprot:9490-Heterococcus_DN1.PRE.1